MDKELKLIFMQMDLRLINVRYNVLEISVNATRKNELELS